MNRREAQKQLEQARAAVEEKREREERREQSEWDHAIKLYAAARHMLDEYGRQYEPKLHRQHHMWSEVLDGYADAIMGGPGWALKRGRELGWPDEVIADDTFWEIENAMCDVGFMDNLIFPEAPDHDLLEKTATRYGVSIEELRERYIHEAWSHNDCAQNPEDD